MKTLTRWIFETCPDPRWAAIITGFAIIGLDGCMYLTDEGEEYLTEQGTKP